MLRQEAKCSTEEFIASVSSVPFVAVRPTPAAVVGTGVHGLRRWKNGKAHAEPLTDNKLAATRSDGGQHCFHNHARHQRKRKCQREANKSVGCEIRQCTNAYIGDTFTVTFKHDWITLHSMLTPSTAQLQGCSIIRCEYRDTCHAVGSGTVDNASLSPATHYMLSQPNAGGNSLLSEALSLEFMHRCFGATLLKTELEIEYHPCGGSMTDYVCAISGHTVAVSVTRAMKYPLCDPRFTWRDAHRLCSKKLKGIEQCNQTAAEQQLQWSRHILFVWCYSRSSARKMAAVFARLCVRGCAVVPASTVLLLVTVGKGTGAPHAIFT